MKAIIIIQALLLISTLIFGQGLNNEYEIDSEDLKNILQEQGINVFKFPFALKKGEYVSISYEIYEKGKQIEQRHIIEDLQIENGIQFNHHHSRNDTTVFHRFYFFEEGDSLLMKASLSGFSAHQKIDISKVKISAFYGRTVVLDSLPEKSEIMFYYALYENSEKIKASGGWLECPAGKSAKELMDSYDLVILFYAERITAERASNILEEMNM
ncbi:hypothetical protein DMA11_17170 [Marinilabiliaceae bacterium JC017]|nr:hypothetical protein DMA11_17170 [Marinilabiliaceae bacterium JC017]